MDLGNLAEFGRSRSATAWATNPVRRVLWWLIAPYFRAAATRIAADISSVEASTAARIDTLAAAVTGTDAGMMEAGKIWQDRANAMIASQMGGLRKDSYAIAQRIAGLEEERGSLTERMAALMREFRSSTDGLEQRHGKLERAMDDLWAVTSELRDRMGPPPDVEALVIAQGANGSRLLVRRHDHIGRRIIAGEEWEPHVRKAIEAAARSGSIAVDAGAYIGIHTLTMARCFSKVHAFEPQKGIFQVLCGNLALNERLNVTTHNAALYDRGVAMRLAPQEHQEVNVPLLDGQPNYQRLDNAAALSFEVADAGEGQVNAIALDDLNLDNVALIKIDTQGSDFYVLKGAERTISQSKPVILFEWERDLAALHGIKLDDIMSYFERLEYDVAVLHETTPERQIDYIAKPRGAI